MSSSSAFRTNDDGSGSIDFEEFYVCVKSRREGGGGFFGLLHV